MNIHSLVMFFVNIMLKTFFYLKNNCVWMTMTKMKVMGYILCICNKLPCVEEIPFFQE